MAEPAERDAAQDRVVRFGASLLRFSQLPPGNSIEPGATQLTRMPFFASTAASLCVYDIIAAFTAP